MLRRDNAYWQRLCGDRPSTATALLAIASGVAAIVALVVLVVGGSQMQARGNPLYWALLVPFAWWGSSLAYYEPWAVRLLKPSLVGWPLLATAVLVMAYRRQESETATAVSLAISVVCSICAASAYRNSLLRCEGPAR